MVQMVVLESPQRKALPVSNSDTEEIDDVGLKRTPSPSTQYVMPEVVLNVAGCAAVRH